MVSVQKLLQIGSAARPLRAYAYLTSTLRGQPADADVFDCLLPFMKAGVQIQQNGAVLNYGDLSSFLESLGLHIPVPVLEQLTSRLQKHGAVERNAGTWFVRNPPRTEGSVDSEDALDQAFNAIEAAIIDFARSRFNTEGPPASPTWNDAIINFLKSETSVPKSAPNTKTNRQSPAKIGATLVGDTKGTERMIVAKFIQECSEDSTKTAMLDHLVQVFTGILIEDFIGTIQSLSSKNTFSRLHVYYDTAVLLRLLGTSGKLLQLGTTEMHNALQQLGCYTHYLDITKREVKVILQGIVANPEGAHPETADAYFSGELQIGEIMDFPDTFEVRLDHEFGITFSSYNQKPLKSLSINENKLTEMLVADATNYKQQSAAKDARAVGIILQLRKGRVSEEIGMCQHLFVSRNPLLQSVSKKFVENEVPDYEENAGSVPPVLTVGQVATLAWLLSTKKMEPLKVTRELLVACYNAVRPTPEWTKKFTQVFNDYAEKDTSVVEQIANSAIFRRTARSLMQDASLNQPALIDPKNISAIVQRAQEEVKRKAELEAEARRRTEDTLREQLLAARQLAEQREVKLKQLEEELVERERQELEERQRIALEVEARKKEEEREEERRRQTQQKERDRERTQIDAGAPQWLRAVALFVVVALPVGCIVLLKDSPLAIVLLIAFVTFAAPLLWAVIFESRKLSGLHLLQMYKVGLSGIRLLVSAVPKESRNSHGDLDDTSKPSTQSDELASLASPEAGSARRRGRGKR